MKMDLILLENPTVLAPMAGITSLPFRLLAKEAGCAIVCSEMISAHALIHNIKKNAELLGRAPEESPLSVQIFGSDPPIMARASAIVQDAGADILDINFGCSVKKIIKTGAGVALMKSLHQAEAVLTAVRHAISIPLTIKIRTGWDPSGADALAISRIAESCGVDAIAVHPRTATQGFSGKADWSVIAAVKHQVSIPVIGNGDITVPSDAIRMIRETGCDAVMVGRASVGNPWIFTQIKALLKNEPPPMPTLSDIFKVMLRYVNSLVAFHGEFRACRMLRSRLGWFVKGLPHSSIFRESIKRISSQQEALERIAAYQETVSSFSCARGASGEKNE